MNEVNTSVLVIDDEEMVRDNIEDILIPRGQSEEQDSIDSAFDVLFGSPKPLLLSRTPCIPEFTVHKGFKRPRRVKKSATGN